MVRDDCAGPVVSCSAQSTTASTPSRPISRLLSEAKQAAGDFIDAMAKILEEANTNPETVIQALFTLPVRRLGDAKVEKELASVWRE